MFSRIHRPPSLTARALDDYLRMGWRCIGQSVYISHFMGFPNGEPGRIYSTLPTRLPLATHQWSKSQRKLLRRNRQAFRIEVGHTARFQAAERVVNEHYARQFGDKAIQEESYYMDNGHGGFTFDTRQVSVYHGDELVAFSYFAQGQKSLYSLQGIYHPDYQSHSLGFYTMLEEIAYAKAQGLEHYYPGYVVPDHPEFDYKHRVGALEYLDLLTGTWRPHAQLSPDTVPINRMRTRLTELANALAEHDIASCRCDYTYFDIRFHDARPYPFVEHPVVLIVEEKGTHSDCPIVVYDPATDCFDLYRAYFANAGVNHQVAYRRFLRVQPRVCHLVLLRSDILGQGVDLGRAVDLLA